MASYTAVPTSNTGDTWTAANQNTYLKDNMTYFKDLTDDMRKVVLNVVIGNGLSVVSTGIAGYVQLPNKAMTIDRIYIVADASGSIVVDVWKDTYANFPPTDSDSITASAPPTLSSAQKNSDTTLTGWTKSCAALDYLGFNVDSAATVKQVTLSIHFTIDL